MTPQKAIQILSRRIQAYSGKPSANAEYIDETVDIINAFIHLYNQYTALQEKTSKMLEYLSADPALQSIPNVLLDVFCRYEFAPGYISPSDIPDYLKAYRTHHILIAHRQILDNIELETLRRQLPPEIRKHLMAYYPEYITDSQQAYTYLAQHYGIFE